jgi:hypothetical protein
VPAGLEQLPTGVRRLARVVLGLGSTSDDD